MTHNRPVDSSFDDNRTNPLQSDTQTDVHVRKVTPDEVAYRDGYVEGQSRERVQATRAQYIRDQEMREQIRESDGVANGLVIGLSLATILGLIAAAFYFLNRSETPAPPAAAPVTVPASPTASPQAQPRNTTIIERTIERTREAAPQVPNVQIIQPQPAAPSNQSPAESVPSTSQPEASGTSQNSPVAPAQSPANAGDTSGSTAAN